MQHKILRHLFLYVTEVAVLFGNGPNHR